MMTRTFTTNATASAMTFLDSFVPRPPLAGYRQLNLTFGEHGCKRPI